MRLELIERIKLEIEYNLTLFLQEEGIKLLIAANDNAPIRGKIPLVILESIEDSPLQGYKLLSEIRVVLGLYGKIWDCDTLVDGIYLALQPHHFTLKELQFLLMSFHVDPLEPRKPRKPRKRTVMRYIVEESM